MPTAQPCQAACILGQRERPKAVGEILDVLLRAEGKRSTTPSAGDADLGGTNTGTR
ncbi:MAG: hypothetical protein ABI563_11140 [Specibacter sp.]